MAVKRTLAPGQPAPGARSKEKFVSLPEELEELELPPPQLEVPPSLFEDLNINDRISTAPKQRISVYCIAESLDRKMLEKKLEARGPRWLVSKYPDVLYGQYSSLESGQPTGDIFYFDYGCVSFWNLTPKQEQDVLKNLVVPCEVDPLPVREVEIDEFDVKYTANEGGGHIQNDTITLNYRLSGDHSIKLSISYALSQSTKLCVFEERVLEIVASTKDLPESLASTGKVTMSRKAIAQLIGKVFIQRAAVNLLSTVLDTPEFFWSAPDIMQTLYKRICEYMELDDRVEVLNNRFSVLHDMLELVSDVNETSHASYLEWIVIWLILICAVIGVFEVLGTLGIVGPGHHFP
ncbi:Required for meiotic nuclear division protein 1 homolog [Coccomyxa sp. Obi]|nr:Required for meiotic nuclear division protein 1 homolog [Coccomyxa sp. Obi]